MRSDDAKGSREIQWLWALWCSAWKSCASWEEKREATSSQRQFITYPKLSGNMKKLDSENEGSLAIGSVMWLPVPQGTGSDKWSFGLYKRITAQEP
jgi:hypothetical protein